MTLGKSGAESLKSRLGVAERHGNNTKPEVTRRHNHNNNNNNSEDQMPGFHSMGQVEERMRRLLVLFKKHNSSKRVKAKDPGLSFGSARSRGRRVKER